MMAPSSSSTSLYKRKRDESSAGEQHGPPSQRPASSKWRTSRAQEAYSSKLLDALRLVRAGGGTVVVVPGRGREVVRDAADRALAAAARGRSRWSRAIILSRRRRRSATATLILRAPSMVPPGGGGRRSSSSSFSSAVVVAARKAKVLGRLVPGCRKLPFGPALLAEVSDYIAALEMQVRSMNAVAQALSSTSS